MASDAPRITSLTTRAASNDESKEEGFEAIEESQPDDMLSAEITRLERLLINKIKTQKATSNYEEAATSVYIDHQCLHDHN